MTEIALRSWSFAVCRSGLSPLVVLSERYFLSLVGDVDASLLWGLNLSSFKVVGLSVLVLILYGDTKESSSLCYSDLDERTQVASVICRRRNIDCTCADGFQNAIFVYGCHVGILTLPGHFAHGGVLRSEYSIQQQIVAHGNRLL